MPQLNSNIPCAEAIQTALVSCHSQTMTSSKHNSTVEPSETWYQLQEKGLWHAHKGYLMLHNSVGLHVVCTVQDTLHCVHLKMLHHPAYNRDLSLPDFHVFSPLREALKGRKFRLDRDVKATVMQWL
jgi:hypothetical protein